jgi:hypothetical protein
MMNEKRPQTAITSRAPISHYKNRAGRRMLRHLEGNYFKWMAAARTAHCQSLRSFSLSARR